MFLLTNTRTHTHTHTDAHTHTPCLSLTKCNCAILFYVISKLGHVIYFIHCHLKYKQYYTRGKRKTDFQIKERAQWNSYTEER